MRRGRSPEVAQQPRDAGAAMIIALFVLALVTVLTATMAATSAEDVTSSRRAKDAAAALAAAEAGVSDSLVYLRSAGVYAVSCNPGAEDPALPGCAGPRTDEDRARVVLPGGGGQSYRTWIRPIAPLPESNPGLYRIYSVGYVGTVDGTTDRAAARRALSVDVAIGTTQTGLPLGLFGRRILPAGDFTVRSASVFSTECVDNRDKIQFFPGVSDLAYDKPPAVHSSGPIVIDANGCGNPPKNPVFTTGSPCGVVTNQGSGSNTLNVNLDQSSMQPTPVCDDGKTLEPDYYAPKNLDGVSGDDVNGSWIKDSRALQTLYGFDAKFVTPDLIDQWRSSAKAAGTYYTATTGYTVPSPAAGANAIVFFEPPPESGGRVPVVDLGLFKDTWSQLDATCKPQNILVVVHNADAKVTRDTELTGSVIVAEGRLLDAGQAHINGTVFTDSAELAGGSQISLTECFLANLSPFLLSFEVKKYRELDN